MAKKSVQVSALDGRIKQGKADPITPAEKRLVAGLRAGYEKKYGIYRSAKTGRYVASTVSGKSAKTSTAKPASGKAK